MSQESINKQTYSTQKALEVYSTSYMWPYEQVLFDSYVKPGMRVLDVGCGTGRSTSFLAKRGADVVGIDMVDLFIEEGKKLYPGLDLRVMNATKLDFPDNFFDFVFFSNQGIDYTEHRTDVHSEAFRVTKPGGLYAFSSHNSLRLPRSIASWKNLLTNIHRWRPGYHVRVEHHENGTLHVAHTNIWSEQALLKSVGFELIEVLDNDAASPRRHPLVTGFLSRWPMYVCRKPAA